MTTTKIFVGSLPEGTTTDDVRALFEAHGKVQECDVIKDYGFVHMANELDARAAISALNGHEYRGVAINVEESRSRVRQRPGMGGRMTCFRCGKQGHWSKECRMGGGGSRSGGGGGFRGPPSRPAPYDRRGGPPPFERRPPPFERSYEDSYERRGGRGGYDRYDGPPPRHGGGYDDYGRGYDRPEPYEDRRVDYYARRSPPPRSDYYRDDGPYSNGGSSYRGESRRPPYGDRYGPHGGGGGGGGRYGRGGSY